MSKIQALQALEELARGLADMRQRLRAGGAEYALANAVDAALTLTLEKYSTVLRDQSLAAAPANPPEIPF